jgi:SOS-response transcriptional repressor LexA
MLSPTPRQLEAFEFICVQIETKGLAPSYEEIAAHLNIKSKGFVHELVNGLEQRGMIRRIPNHARCIEIVNEEAWKQVVRLPELRGAVQLYARKHGIKPDTAINELLRQSLGIVE